MHTPSCERVTYTRRCHQSPSRANSSCKRCSRALQNLKTAFFICNVATKQPGQHLLEDCTHLLPGQVPGRSTSRGLN